MSQIRAVITDWAGTIVDYGSLAPVTVVRQVFEQEGVAVTHDEARQPMGRAKRDHLAAVIAMPRVAKAWAAANGRSPEDADVDRLYAAFLPLQKRILAEFSHPIPGVIDAIAALRARGIEIGSTTGYTRELMAVVSEVANLAGLSIDTVIAADDVPAGRPAPWMIFRAAERLGVYPMSDVVAVDDTPVGIQAGRAAGAWSIAVARTGNALGMNEADANALTSDQWKQLRIPIERAFVEAGAHFVIDSFAELPAVIAEIDQRLARGDRPG